MNLPTRDELAMSATDKDLAFYEFTEYGERRLLPRHEARYAYADAMIAARGAKDSKDWMLRGCPHGIGSDPCYPCSLILYRAYRESYNKILDKIDPRS